MKLKYIIGNLGAYIILGLRHRIVAGFMAMIYLAQTDSILSQERLNTAKLCHWQKKRVYNRDHESKIVRTLNYRNH